MQNTNQKLTVLQVIPRLVSGGAEKGALEIANALIQNGHTAIIASEGGRMVTEFEAMGGLHITLPLSSKSPLKMYRNIHHLHKIILDHKVDIIHSRSRGPAWSAYYAAKRAKKTIDIKVVTTYHGLYGETNFIKKKYNHIMVQADAIIAVSDFIAKNILERYPATPKDKVHIIKRGVNLIHYSPEKINRQRIEQLISAWGLADDLRHVILLPARITRIKGHESLITAVEALSKKRQDFICVCIGDIHSGKDQYAKKIIKQIKSLDLENYFLFPGGCLDMPAAYAISYIITAPSTKPEAFGRIPIEAQIMGKPIVATQHGGYCETILNGYTGFLFPPTDIESYVSCLDAALNLSQRQRLIMAKTAQEHISKNFSVKIMCEKTLALYHAII